MIEERKSISSPLYLRAPKQPTIISLQNLNGLSPETYRNDEEFFWDMI
jgi:hypothetical protein